jgi:ribosome-associated protein
MDIEKCKLLIIEAIDDVKGRDVKFYDTTKNTFLFDLIIIATIESTRQANAILKKILDKKFLFPIKPTIEGSNDSGWILIDCNDIIVHLMTKHDREYYNLEELWGNNE